MTVDSTLLHLTAAEQDHLDRAHRLLDRTDLVADDPGPTVNQEALYEGRFAARGVILLAAELRMARAAAQRTGA